MSVIGMENEILGAVIVAMVIFYLKHIGNKFIDAREKNKRFSIWMKHLQIDTDIDKCVNLFEQIISQETWPKVNEIIAYFGLILPIIIFIFLNIFHENPLKSFVYFSWIYITFSLLFMLVLPYAVDKINRKNLLTKARMNENWFQTTKFFIFNFNLIIISILLSLSLQQNQTISGFKIVEETINFLILVLIASMIGMEIIHKSLLDEVKTALNAQHMADYPLIHITTKEADFTGKIQDVFNKILLILDDNGQKIIVEWNEITTMELLKEESEIDHSPPPSSQEKS